MIHDEATIRENLRKLVETERENIDQYGFASRSVFGGRQGFTYSMGFYRIGVPDVIIFGLPAEVSHGLLWRVYHLAKEESRTFKDGDVVDDIANMPMTFKKFNPGMWDDHVGGILNHAGLDGVDDPQCLVMVWPDGEGLFPWDEGYDEKFRGSQPTEAWALN